MTANKAGFRVLMLASWGANESSPAKGIFIKRHAEAIARQGHTIDYISIDVAPGSKWLEIISNQEILTENFHCWTVTLKSKYSGKIAQMLPLYRLILRHVLRKNKLPLQEYNLIHSHVTYPMGVLGDQLAKSLNIPHVVTEHWSGLQKFLQKSIWRNRCKTALRSVSALSVVSKSQAETIQNLIPEISNRITIIPNTINTQLFHPPSTSAIQPNTPLEWIVVASWRLPKRLDLVTQSLISFAKSHRQEMKLHIVGEGEQLIAFNNENHPLPHNLQIIQHGFITSQQIAQLMQQCNYFLHASNMETFCIVAVEAMSCGLPVLASDLPAIRELVNTDSGVLCSNTVENWIQGLQEITSKNFNPVEIRKRVVEKYSENTVGKAFTSLYQRCLSDFTYIRSGT